MQITLLIIFLASIYVAIKSGFNFLCALVGFESFGGKFNIWMMVASWCWVGLIYLLYLNL